MEVSEWKSGSCCSASSLLSAEVVVVVDGSERASKASASREKRCSRPRISWISTAWVAAR